MKTSSLIAMAAATICLSGCIAYPFDERGGDRGREHGAQREPDRDRDHRDEHRDDGHGENRNGRPDCDPRASDCPRR